jgi:hypothetical protein
MELRERDENSGGELDVLVTLAVTTGSRVVTSSSGRRGVLRHLWWPGGESGDGGRLKGGR